MNKFEKKTDNREREVNLDNFIKFLRQEADKLSKTTDIKLDKKATLRNYMGIIGRHTNVSMTLMTLTLTLQSAGFAGFYGLYSKDNFIWGFLLSAIMLSITLILYTVWYREHSLKKLCTKFLINEAPEIGCPKEDKELEGKTAEMWGLVYRVCIGIWSIALVTTYINEGYNLNIFELSCEPFYITILKLFVYKYLIWFYSTGVIILLAVLIYINCFCRKRYKKYVEYGFDKANQKTIGGNKMANPRYCKHRECGRKTKRPDMTPRQLASAKGWCQREINAIDKLLEEKKPK